MIHIHVTNREGHARSIEADEGGSLMETLRAHGFDEILAVCGGCCACATCHVYVEADGAAPLQPRSDDEDALLEGSDHLKPQSRLSCQIPLTAERDGLRVTIAPED